jgi:hypothetical protein
VTDGQLFISPHITPAVIKLLSTAAVSVVVVTFAPQSHTMHIFHVLDLTLFGVLKRRDQYQLPLEDDAGSARFIRKVYQDFRMTMTMTMIEPNIWGTFRAFGLSIRLLT